MERAQLRGPLTALSSPRGLVESGIVEDAIAFVARNTDVRARFVEGTRREDVPDYPRDVMRDYGYLEHMGMGVPRKIIAGMRAHNGTNPDFLEGEERLTVRLWRDERS